MSVRALNWALRDARVQVEVHGVERSVLIVLADHADAADHAWPSLATICAEAGWKETAVKEALAELEDGGFIESAGYRQRARLRRLKIDATSPSNGDVTALGDKDVDATSPSDGYVTSPSHGYVTATSPRRSRDVAATSPSNGYEPEPEPEPKGRQAAREARADPLAETVWLVVGVLQRAGHVSADDEALIATAVAAHPNNHRAVTLAQKLALGDLGPTTGSLAARFAVLLPLEAAA